ncbi:MAG: uroporphyrinogen-III synthase, partial [Patescibacteria group bacterium]|nr:uroporphyrinogen-III synthase [Patescibacteria group bacterium]
DQVVARLLADGWSPATPAAIVERGTLAWERRVSGPISHLAELARRGNVASPAIVAVGEAARSIAAFRRRPTILYTGLDAANFRLLGNVLHWPAQAIVPHSEGYRLFPHALTAIERGNVGWVVFTDKFAVRSFFAAMGDHRQDARVLGGIRIAAIGDETLRQLDRWNLRADATVSEDDLRSPAAALGNVREQGILIVQGSHAPRGLCEKLEDAGATVSPLALNRLVPHPELGRPLPEHDVIYFVSPAGVRAYAKAYGNAAFQRKIWCLGEATQQALAARGAAAAIVRPQLSSSPCLARQEAMP